MSKSSVFRKASQFFEQQKRRNETADDGLTKSSLTLHANAPGFTHLQHPGFDTGTFALDEVRQCSLGGDRGGSRIVTLPKNRYSRPPQFAKGLKACDLNHWSRTADGRSAIDLDVTILTHPKNASTVRPIIQAWNSNCRTSLIRNAEMTWMEAKQCTKDCLIFTTCFNLQHGARKQHVQFPRPFNREYEIVCWIKDFRFDTWHDTSYAADAWASNVSAEGFTANVAGSKSLERLAVTWIVYYKGKPKVSSGVFSTEDIVERVDQAPQNSGRINFPAGTFTRPPTVLVALSQFDLAGWRDLCVGVYVLNVDCSGFDWQLNSWGEKPKDALRSAEASFIALGFS